ncbi:hypothetical protein HW555_013709 [Spodoptera exigua]|uniref:BESS domain-containing protein n=1 Tax=Spodoptera exigua TaxID=7107 RepID=A0A835G553_SPOEX|nr:hypothetical protein HW555_013709 [Spodoptera exigua]
MRPKNVQQRWKTARDAYMCCKNFLKNTQEVKKKVYINFEDMKFLDKKHQAEVEDSIESNQATPSAINQDIPSTSNQHVPSTSSQDIPRSTGLEVNTELQESVAQENSTDSNFRNKHCRKRKQTDTDEFDKEMLKMFKDNAKLFKNDDMNFFMSLLPITEKFTTHQKLIFRTEMLKKAMEISNIHNPYEITSRPNSSDSYHSQQSESILRSQDPMNVHETFPDMSNTVSQECVMYEVRPTTSYTLNSGSQIISQGYQTIHGITRKANKDK